MCDGARTFVWSFMLVLWLLTLLLLGFLFICGDMEPFLCEAGFVARDGSRGSLFCLLGTLPFSLFCGVSAVLAASEFLLSVFSLLIKCEFSLTGGGGDNADVIVIKFVWDVCEE